MYKRQELRDSLELLSFNYNNTFVNITKGSYPTFNPAFDITPAKYIDYIITDKNIIKYTSLLIYNSIKNN